MVVNVKNNNKIRTYKHINFSIFFGLLSLQKNIQMPLSKKLTIKEIIRETKDAISILFNVPEEFKSQYSFFAGQYVNLKLTLDGKEIRRAYSICSSPESGDLKIAIKAVENGTFSQFANTKLKVGDILEVGEPEGKFIFKPQIDLQKNYASFVAGSGITPVISILKSVLISEPQSNFILVYGNKTPEETIFREELHELQLKYTGRLFVHYVYSKTKDEDLINGRIDKSVVHQILNDKNLPLEFDQFYLCGPEDMINTVTGILKEKNIKDSSIKFELFSSPSSENIEASNYDGQSKVSITVDDEETTFEMSKNQTILDAALKHGIDAPYSCQGGICSSCLARVKSGSAEMKKNSILSESEVAEGLILTCQAHPTSAEIVIDFDDV